MVFRLDPIVFLDNAIVFLDNPMAFLHNPIVFLANPIVFLDNPMAFLDVPMVYPDVPMAFLDKNQVSSSPCLETVETVSEGHPRGDSVAPWKVAGKPAGTIGFHFPEGPGRWKTLRKQ